MLTGGKISPADLDLLTVTDSPEEVLQQVTQEMIEAGTLEAKEQAARDETRKAFKKKSS
jgi:hypothetical protein